jgi:hypothetical protein
MAIERKEGRMNTICAPFLRVLVAGVLIGGLTLGATSVQAQADVSIRPAITIAPAIGPPGSDIGIRGIGFTCGGQVSLYLSYRTPVMQGYLGSAIPQGVTGRLQARGRVPGEAPYGRARVLAVQGACRAWAPFMVCRACLEARLDGHGA